MVRISGLHFAALLSAWLVARLGVGVDDADDGADRLDHGLCKR